MATVASVTLTAPASDPNIDEGNTFAMTGDVADANHGGMDYDMYWEYDQGTSTWITIPASGSELTVPASNPLLNHGTKGTTSKTITGVGAGVYEVRIRTIDNNDGGATDLSGTQTVTVNAVGRRSTKGNGDSLMPSITLTATTAQTQRILDAYRYDPLTDGPADEFIKAKLIKKVRADVRRYEANAARAVADSGHTEVEFT